MSDINMTAAGRPYTQELRAEQTRANGLKIAAATVALIKRTGRVADVTLDDVARESGLTVRTILRRFGSRDGVLEAAFARMEEEFRGLRPPARPGDIDSAVHSIVTQYEAIGPLNIRALEQEESLPLIHRMLDRARGLHRAWLAEAFAPNLARFRSAERERRITALYAATDVYLWKLLRRDLKHSRRETEDIFGRLVRGVLS